MRFKTAKVISHPRAGSHYLTHLLNINFFNLPNYLPLYAGHSYSHKNLLKNNATAVFYIFRNDLDTIKSMYKLKNRWGLKAGSLKSFKSSTFKSMYNSNTESEVIRNIAGIKENFFGVDSFFSNVNLTPEEYLQEHKNFFLKIYKNNFYPVSYDKLIYNLNEEMLGISEFLESDKIKFITDSNRVGWYDKNDHKKFIS